MKIRIYEEPVSIIREADRNHGYEVDLPIDIVIRFRHSLAEFRRVQDALLVHYREAWAAEEAECVEALR